MVTFQQMLKGVPFSLSLLATVSIGVCSSCSSHDDERTDEPVPPPLVVPDPSTPTTVIDNDYGIDGSKVSEFFTASLTDRDAATYGIDGALNPADIDGVKEYVWGRWSQAVAGEANHLPSLADRTAEANWDDVSVADAEWNMNGDNLGIFYASKGVKPAKGFPLFLFLHGSGADPEEEWNALKMYAGLFDDAPSAYFIPKSPYGGVNCRWYQPSRQDAWETMLRQAFLSKDINPDKIYVMGISEGGYGSQRLASFYADYLAGAGPIAAGDQLFGCPPENLANIGYCLQTGELDTSYGRAELTQRMKDELDRLAEAKPGHYVHKVDLQAGKGHGCDYYVTAPWLKHMTRVATPRYVRWENFPMGGINGEGTRYRRGFYNLRVLEPSDARDNDMVRSSYEMTIGDDNSIDLSVNVVTVSATDYSSSAGLNLGTEKSYAPATSGSVRIYLSDELVDLSRPVTVRVNGVERFNGVVEPNVRHIVESCALFFDPARLFPAAVDVTVAP